MQPYKQDINHDNTYKQTGGRTQPMQPCLFEDLAEIYSTPTPKGLAGAENGWLYWLIVYLTMVKAFIFIARNLDMSPNWTRLAYKRK
jgi:hypothetical protein